MMGSLFRDPEFPRETEEVGINDNLASPIAG